MQTTLDVYYMDSEGYDLFDMGVEVVRQVFGASGAMVTVRGTYRAVCTFVTTLYGDCEGDDILCALPSLPGDPVGIDPAPVQVRGVTVTPDDLGTHLV